MSDISASVTALRRPKLLVRAARIGSADYRRERDLKRIVHQPEPLSPAGALSELIEIEADLEATRRNGAAGYSPVRHVEVLIALIAEAHLLTHPVLKAIT